MRLDMLSFIFESLLGLAGILGGSLVLAYVFGVLFVGAPVIPQDTVSKPTASG